MNGNFTSPLTFNAGTNDLVMSGPLVATAPEDLNVAVRIEVELLNGAGKVLEQCKSNGNGFRAAFNPPGATWSMIKSTNKVARGDTVTAHGTARDAQGHVLADWRSQVDIA
jgi:hypothetical protein